MADGERRDQEELVSAGAEAHVQFQLIQREELAFGRLARLKEVHRGEKVGQCGGRKRPTKGLTVVKNTSNLRN